jgi:hypothetical protein
MQLGGVILGYTAELQIQLLQAINYFPHTQAGVVLIMNFLFYMQLMLLHTGLLELM